MSEERAPVVSQRGTMSVDELVEAMNQRWQELVALRASPDMYGSESLDGQLSELELWLLQARRVLDGGSSALDRAR